jgi:hypothetical protein
LFKIFNELGPWKQAHRSMVIDFPNSEDLIARRRTSQERNGTIIAFYTKDTIYEREKERLLTSALHLGLEATAVGVENAGSWVRNAGLKPGVLVEQRKALRGPLLYVDVDAVFHRDPWPELLSIQSDIAVYYEMTGHLLSGTILINDTPSALALMEAWQKGCRDNPETWDQLVLERIITEDAAKASPSYSVSRLPVSFCWIFDRIENEPVDQIYIEHLQASREMKQRRRLFGRLPNRVRRRRDRVADIERILYA